MTAQNLTGSSSRLPFKRFHESADIRSDDNLVAVQLRYFFRCLADRRQMISFHVGPNLVVVIHPLAHNVIQTPLADKDELLQTLLFDRLNETLYPVVAIFISSCR